MPLAKFNPIHLPNIPTQTPSSTPSVNTPISTHPSPHHMSAQWGKIKINNWKKMKNECPIKCVIFLSQDCKKTPLQPLQGHQTLCSSPYTRRAVNADIQDIPPWQARISGGLSWHYLSATTVLPGVLDLLGLLEYLGGGVLEGWWWQDVSMHISMVSLVYVCGDDVARPY